MYCITLRLHYFTTVGSAFSLYCYRKWRALHQAGFSATMLYCYTSVLLYCYPSVLLYYYFGVLLYFSR